MRRGRGVAAALLGPGDDLNATLYALLRQRAAAPPPLPDIPRRLHFERADGAALLRVAPLPRSAWPRLGASAALVALLAGLLLWMWAVDAHPHRLWSYMVANAAWMTASAAGLVTSQGWARRQDQVGFSVRVDGAGIRYAQERPQGRGPTPVEGFWPHHQVRDVVVYHPRGWGFCWLVVAVGEVHIPLAVGLTRAEAVAAQALIARAIART